MSSRVGRLLARAAQAADESEQVGRAVENLSRTPERAATAPVRAAESSASTAARAGAAGLVGSVGLGSGAYAFGQRQQRLETEAEAEEREDTREQLNRVLDDESIPDDVQASALERAIDSGLFSADLGGDSENPDNIFENVWFRRAIALIAAYYLFKTFQSRFG